MNALYGDEMVQYLKTKYDWDDETFNDIDWDAHEYELSKVKGLLRISIHKLLHRWQPTNKVVQRNERRSKQDAKCTECDAIDDQLHYMKCKSEYFEEARRFSWKKFKTKMKKYKRYKTMLEIMWIGIKRWVNDEDDDDLPRGDDVTPAQFDLLINAYKHQCGIGWDHFITGRITKEWSIYYESNLEENDEKRGKVMAFARDTVKAT